MASPASVADVVPAYADAFPFESFNEMQQTVIPAILEDNANVVVSAPTGSGKTAIAELAMCHCLSRSGTVLYITPLRALTTEREAEWQRFERLGHTVYVVTGERELSPDRADRADILVMTPEKVDAATRKHRTDRYGFITEVDCCIVDEVHLLDTASRGSVLEATIVRLRRLASPRVVAMSATMANVEDVAAWLDAPSDATFQFDDSHRPVPLEATVRPFDPGDNDFADKYRRLYQAIEVATPHLKANGQVLVFVASRRDANMAAETIADTDRLAGVDLAIGDDYEAHQLANEVSNESLRTLTHDGIAFHHAGLSRGDRSRVETLFRRGAVSVLVSTTTLAWGVNLPARCVIIRDTHYHDPLAGPVPMNPIDVLQMLGRAGRPGYDDIGYGVIICRPDETPRFQSLLDGSIDIESRLLAHLEPHLNTEIALGAVSDESSAFAWARETCAWIQFGSGAVKQRVTEAVRSLIADGHVIRSDDGGFQSTEQGRLAARYYLALPTAERFVRLAGNEEASALTVVETLARCPEFGDVTPRSREREAIESVLGPNAPADPGEAKVLAVLVASMEGDLPRALRDDAWIIRRTGARLLGALGAWCRRSEAFRMANLVTRLVHQIEYALDERAAGLLAVDGIGPDRAQSLIAVDIDTPTALMQADDAVLTRAGWPDHACTDLRRAARAVPTVHVDWTPLPTAIGSAENQFVTIPIHTTGDATTAAIWVRVNGVEMHQETTRLGSTNVPIAIYGGGASHFRFEIEVVFPTLPVLPCVTTHDVTVQ